jgi:hypothetical protein
MRCKGKQSIMARSYKSNDARDLVKSPKKVAVAPVVVEKVVLITQPGADHCFQPGDIVSFRSNTRGIVLAVSGDGVQVDFGLGAGWFSQHSLTLIETASVVELTETIL